jgi:hypothetical protein
MRRSIKTILLEEVQHSAGNDSPKDIFANHQIPGDCRGTCASSPFV